MNSTAGSRCEVMQEVRWDFRRDPGVHSHVRAGEDSSVHSHMNLDVNSDGRTAGWRKAFEPS